MVRRAPKNSTENGSFVGYEKPPTSLTLDVWMKFVVIEGGVEMVKRLMAVMLMALLIAAVASVPGVAEADEPDYTDSEVVMGLITELEEAEDMRQAFSGLSLEAQQAVVDSIMAGSVERVETSVTENNNLNGRSVSDTGSALTVTCSRHTVDYVYRSTVGLKIWKYTSKTHWCWDGTKITSDPDFTTAGTIILQIGKPFWDYKGDRKVSSQGGEGEWSFTDRAEGHFRFHIPLDPEIDLKEVTLDPTIFNVYPTIWKYQYANGEASNETSG